MPTLSDYVSARHCSPSRGSLKRKSTALSRSFQLRIPIAKLADLGREGLHIDGLHEVAAEASLQKPLAVTLPGEGSERNDAEIPCGGICLQGSEGGDAVHSRQLDVHQDEVRGLLLHQLQRGFGGGRLDGAEAPELRS